MAFDLSVHQDRPSLPFDSVKIDRCFMQAFGGSGRDARTVVKMIIAHVFVALPFCRRFDEMSLSFRSGCGRRPLRRLLKVRENIGADL